jgi:hypothetical protein
MRVQITLLVLFVTLAMYSATPTQAQNAAADCSALIETTLSDLVTFCGNTEGTSACYAHQGVYAAFLDSSQPVTFDIPGDRTPLASIETITASAPDFSIGQWGAAILNLSPFAIKDTQSVFSAAMLLFGAMTLENMDSSGQAPMQSIQLSSSSDDQTCGEAPAALAIRTDPDIPLGFSVNGVNMRLSSVVIFQPKSANSITVTVEDGQLEIIDGPTARAGQTLAGVMDNTGKILFWSAPRPSNAEENQAMSVVKSAFNRLGFSVSPSPLPSSPTPFAPISATTTPQPSTTTSICGKTHVVQAGENLFRIALRYGVALDAVAAANGLANPYLIHVGQQLVIPCS